MWRPFQSSGMYACLLLVILGGVMTPAAWAQKKKSGSCSSEAWLAEIQQKIDVEGHWDEAYTLWDAYFPACDKSSEAWYQWGDRLLENRWSFAPADDKPKWVKKRLAFFQKYDLRFPQVQKKHAAEKALLMAQSTGFTASAIQQAFEKAYWMDAKAFATSDRWTQRMQVLVQWYNQVTPQPQLWMCQQLWSEAIILQGDTTAEATLKRDYLSALWQQLFTTEMRMNWAQQQWECDMQVAPALALLADYVHQWSPQSPLMQRIAEQFEKVNPCSESAQWMALWQVSQRQTDAAIRWYTQAVERSHQVVQQAQWRAVQARLAQNVNNKAQARKFLLQAIDLQPQNTQYLTQLMDLYAHNDDCSEVDRSMLYALAYQCCLQLEQVNPSQAKRIQANKLFYQSKMPNAAALQQLPEQDHKKFVGCWLQEWVVLP